MDWVIGMEDKTVWVAHGENSDIIAIAASDREAARAMVQTHYFSLDDEGAVSYEAGPRRLGHTSVRKAAEKCKLDVETFLVKALRGQLRDYWIDDCSIEEYAVSRYLWPLT